MRDTTPPAVDKSRVDSHRIDRKRAEIDREPVDGCEIDRDPVDSPRACVARDPALRRRQKGLIDECLPIGLEIVNTAPPSCRAQSTSTYARMSAQRWDTPDRPHFTGRKKKPPTSGGF
jgi:hypothetical protein